ncbi:flavin-containing monooxygenase FMO GS-OX5 isoform X2 [Gadus morhua]|uniref:Flavin-containing monooxygenase n=1 Tax=Gadus morhua TaxID=8049 RepID=A0A8C4YZJ2_GADMO|nr:flavin-containing monooxygenase FMO GS-OX5-like isoform X2 [Gadus morhua]
MSSELETGDNSDVYSVGMSKLRVAVVGAGAAGLCAARHILARPALYDPPVVYELTENVGGTWCYEERVGCYGNGHPIPSSMYKNLRTNLPKEVMMFPDFPFDEQLPSFLPHQEVQRYLERYSQSHQVTPHIQFSTVVDEVKPITLETEGAGPKTVWEVKSSDKEGSQKMERFDSVFVCSGHYSDPCLPDIPGMEHFKGTVMHSHSYRVPEPYSGQSVVVLGAGASGLDISMELAGANAQVILSHGKPPFTFPLPPGLRQAPPLTRVNEDGTFSFMDGSGTRAQVLLLCTGYNYTFPYLRGPALGLEVRRELVSPLYRFLLPPAFPSLFIIGVCKLILPFPHFHCQVQFALRVLEGAAPLPSGPQMEEEVREHMEAQRSLGVPSKHLLRLQKEQWGYCQDLARDGGFAPIPAVTRSLYEEVWRCRNVHPQDYRKANYRLVSDTQWVLKD